MKNVFEKLLFATAIFTALQIVGCNSQPDSNKGSRMDAEIDQKEPEKIKINFDGLIDLKSPDTAVKSWWKFLDANQQLDVAYCQESIKKEKFYNEYVKKMTRDEMESALLSRSYCRNDSYAREIEEVKSESETRAIVFARIKVTTPIPPDSTLSTEDKKNRRNGFLFKYILEKSGSSWKISQVFKYDEFGLRLNGNVWQKQYEDNPDKYVSSYVYGQ